MIRIAVLLFSLFSATTAHAALQLETVAENVYALIGPITGRTADNHALNANMGFVVTSEGVALIDSGASARGAALIEKQIARVTDQPVRWVINTGSQDHRWLGNGYFADKGAEIIALERTAATQQSQAGEQLSRLKGILGEALEGTKPYPAPNPLRGDHHTLVLGGEIFQLRFYADAHWPGDIVVFLPRTKTLFSGDHIYVDRMLGVLPQSDVRAWRRAFGQAMALEPERIVPGHGGVCGREKAQRETGDYLNFLVEGVSVALEDWKSLGETVEALGDAPQFTHLEHYGAWHRTNVNRAYLQLEAE